jgi:hypothetical protein
MPLSRFLSSPSPGEYLDSDPNGGFNPNSNVAPLDMHRGGFNSDLNTFLLGGINLNGSSPAHRRVPISHAGQERLSPSSSAYFGVTGQDARSAFGGMGDDAIHHSINDGSTMRTPRREARPSLTKKRREEKKAVITTRTMSRLSPPRPRPCPRPCPR